MSCTPDVLAPLPVDEVAAWYRRLAVTIGRRRVGGEVPLAAQFLSTYLAPASRTAPVTFRAPDHLRGASAVADALAYHRRVYLSQERARVGGRQVEAGVRPRWRDPARYGWDRSSPLTMHYESLVQLPLRWQVTGSEAERDLLTSLGLGFQLRTEVTCHVVEQDGGLQVTFARAEVSAVDVYDFNYAEHFTVPNPDHGAASGVSPEAKTVKVCHTNAKRLEDARLAATYPLRVGPWRVSLSGGRVRR